MSDGILPLFPIMLDLGKIKELVESGKDGLPPREEINRNLNAASEGEYGGLINTAALSFLIQHFGPDSENPCVFQPLGEMYIPPGQRDLSRIKAYWAFTPELQPGQEPKPQQTIVFEAEMSPAGQLVLKKCMLGAADLGFILVFHYSCCAVGKNGDQPFSMYFVAPLNNIYSLQHSLTILAQRDLAEGTFPGGRQSIEIARPGDSNFSKLVQAIAREGTPRERGFLNMVRGWFLG